MSNIRTNAGATAPVRDAEARIAEAPIWETEPPSRENRTYEHTGSDGAGPGSAARVVDEALGWTTEEIRALDASQARTATDALLCRLRALDQGSVAYSRVRARLVEVNLSLVRFAVRGMSNRGASREDVMQTGMVGLIKALDAFDPERGIAFASYALPTIRGEVKRLFRDTCWPVHVPRGQQELFLAVTRAADTLHQRLGREASNGEVAAHLGIDEGEVAYGRDADHAYTVDSLDTPVTDARHGRAAALVERLGAEEPELDLVEFRASVRPLIARLDHRDQEILKLRFWDCLSQSEIGQRLGLSQMHISRLLNRILGELRGNLSAA
ncbi:sigma-70 family RNA polymerase sigma factor [Streptodolium elevatio]|uniref:Sigma-70 family RNA polymerase sigma factor n=1 Tax=Streptodolium elevatio TaxID=3157996 RepID=A0ABV3DJQ6_9ACTN